MGKLGRAIAAGVHGAGTSFLAASQEQDRIKREDERLSKEDAFKERQLSIQEKDAALRADAAERQKFFDDAKIRHAKLAEGFATSGGNMNLEAEALTKHFPDKRIYKFNQRTANSLDAFAVMDISFLDKDPVTGEVKVDELTGLPTEIVTKAPTNQVVFKTQADYEKFKAFTVSPEGFLAYQNRKMSNQEAIDQQMAIADMIEKSEAGKRAAAGQKAKTELDIAKAGQARRSPAGSQASTKQKSKMQNLPGHKDGDTSNLTIQEMQQVDDDADRLKENIESITAQEVRYIQQGREMYPNWVDNVAQEVVEQGKSKAEIAGAEKAIRSKYKVSITTARRMLQIALEGKESKQPGFFAGLMDSMFGSDVPTDEQF